jgi:hypothetical protein
MSIINTEIIPTVLPPVIDDLNIPKVRFSNINKEQKIYDTIYIFILGSFIILVIYSWINVVNTLINIYFELIHPTTPLINQNIKPDDLLETIFKQFTYAIVITVIIYIYLYMTLW